MRQIDFLADEPGDWAFHCHKAHHAMNAMGHNVPTMIGVDHTGIIEGVRGLIPEYMAMSERGMADMAEMEMAIPENTTPMMTGDGPFGSVEMGGMFSMLKVRKDQPRGDYSDPGWYEHPPGTIAYEFKGSPAEPKRSDKAGKGSMKLAKRGQPSYEVSVRKPKHIKH
jgi:hypothetical protein